MEIWHCVDVLCHDPNMSVRSGFTIGLITYEDDIVEWSLKESSRWHCTWYEELITFCKIISFYKMSNIPAQHAYKNHDNQKTVILSDDKRYHESAQTRSRIVVVLIK